MTASRFSGHIDTATDFRIRAGVKSDLSNIVAIHLAAFPRFFLSVLGRRFLTLFYSDLMSSSKGILLAAEDSGGSAILGFVAGVTVQAGFYRELLLNHKWHYAFAALPFCLRNPRIVPRLLRALRRPADSQASAASACLMSIAVHPVAEGKGIGRHLVHEFCAQLRSRGVTSVCLTTDTRGNDRVNLFYERLGFRLVRQFKTAEKREMNEYFLDLKE